MVNLDLLKTRLEHIRTIAKYNRWEESEHCEELNIVIFSRNNDRMNICYFKMKIIIYLFDPNRGIDKIYYRRVTKEILGKLFRNPRAII